MKHNSNGNESAKTVAAVMAHQVAEDFDKSVMFDFGNDDDVFYYVSPIASPAFHAIKTNEQIFADAGVTTSDSDSVSAAASSAVACRRIVKPVHTVRRTNAFGRTETIMSALTAAVVLCVPFVFTLLASLMSNYLAAVMVCSTAMYSMLGIGACGAMVAVIAYVKRGKEWRKQFSIIAGCTIMTAVIAAAATKMIFLFPMYS